MRLLFVISCASALVNSCWCARIVNAKERANEVLRRRSTERHFKRDTEIDVLSVDSLMDLKPGENLKDDVSDATAEGTTKIRLQETYKGVAVLGGNVVIEEDKHGLTGEASGILVDRIDEDIDSITPALSTEDAFEIALDNDDLDIGADKVKNLKTELKIYTENNEAKLVYKVVYLAKNNGTRKRPSFLIDANSGEVLRKWDALTQRCKSAYGIGGNTYTGEIVYGVEPHCLDVERDAKGRCKLDTGYVRVVNYDKNPSLDFDHVKSFRCLFGYEDSVNGGYSPALDAFYHATLVRQMFNKWFNTEPVKGHLNVVVHELKEANAYWDGYEVSLGDGDRKYYPFTTMDSVAHEAAHGFTEMHSGLIYEGESGGIDESFSDIIGESAEAFMGSADFKVGTEASKTGIPDRYFKDPTFDGKSIKNVADMTSTLDPHYSSGIFNTVFYKMVKYGMTIKDAAHVFVHANMLYWWEETSFIDGACDVARSAYDLGQDVQTVIKAFKKVGITVCDINDHVKVLKPNRTYDDITVSVNTCPVFRFVFPFAPGVLHIEALAQNNVSDIYVEVRSGYDISIINDLMAEELDTGLTKVPSEGLTEILLRFQLFTGEETRATIHMKYFCDEPAMCNKNSKDFRD